MSQFRLKFIWFGSKGIAVALNQIYMEKSLPVTEFFFWPRSDAWDDMRICLKSKSWISANDLVFILNQLTEVINFWQDDNDLPIDKLNELNRRFPECEFVFCN